MTWEKGVRQGHPLSPLLLNLYLESLPQAAEAKCGKCGTFVGRAEENISCTVQAYTDDGILISREPKGIRAMLEVLEHFVNWSQMEVNVKKYATAS
jgi:hypothetical protein